MKRLFAVLLSALMFFLLVDNSIFNNGFANYFKKDLFKTNKGNYRISSNLDYYRTNKYYKKDISDYVDMTDNFRPKNKKELLDVYYTILNNGWENFSFYCDDSYSNCLKDMEILSKDNKELSMINQLLNPYNSFSSIVSNYNSDGRIDVEVTKKYSNEEIESIDDEIDNIIDEIGINNTKSLRNKIRLFHDYIASMNVYDSDKENGDSNYMSDKAIGTLFEGHSICSGYTDTLSLFLDKINVENYKIATDEHTWNAILINNKWYHVDLTWDDPITSTGDNIIQYDYFMVTTDELKRKDSDEHNYNTDIFGFVI